MSQYSFCPKCNDVHAIGEKECERFTHVSDLERLCIEQRKVIERLAEDNKRLRDIIAAEAGDEHVPHYETPHVAVRRHGWHPGSCTCGHAYQVHKLDDDEFRECGVKDCSCRQYENADKLSIDAREYVRQNRSER